MKKREKLWLGLIVAAMMVGPVACAPRVLVSAVIPPQLALPNVRRVAVAPFSPRQWGGKEGLILSDLIASRLSSSEAQRLFQVLENNTVPQGMRTQSMQRALAINEINGMGRQLRVQAVIVGRITYYRVSHRRWRKQETYFVDGERHVRRVRCLTRIGSVGATMRVVQTGTGAVMHSITRYTSQRSTGCGRNRGLIISGHYLLQQATEKLAEALSQPLIPEVQRLSIVMETGGQDKRINIGVKFAKRERWERAEELWHEVLRSNPRSYRALYNLGVAAEVRGALHGARRYYRRAERLIPKSLYIDAMRRIDDRIRNRREMRKLQRIQKTKPKISPADDPTAG